MAGKQKAYWLFKSEPDVFSIQDLAESRNQTASWEGIRNYQARNYLRDQVKPGDDVLFYHSRIEPIGVAGIATVVKGGYVDHHAFDSKSDYYDSKSRPEKPQWYMVDVRLKLIFNHVVTLKKIKTYPELQNMALLKSSRLSIQPVTEDEFKFILEIGRNS